MLKSNYILGGEQSGHIIFKELANTGDGELTSLQILNIMSKNNKKLSELASVMNKYPQVLINAKIPVSKRDLWPIVVDSEDKIVWIPKVKKSKYNRRKEEDCDIIFKCY